MERVGEHPVPAGPLAVRWLAYELPVLRAGTRATARVRVQNAGSAHWRSHGREGVQVASHWLDTLGNAIVWDGERTPFAEPVPPRAVVDVDFALECPRPPGRYRLAVDLVEEHRFWFAEVGSHQLELPVEVEPRIAARRLAALVHGGAHPATTEALAAQEEPIVAGDEAATAHLVAGAVPAPDWSRRLLDAHAEGWAAVGPRVVRAGGRIRRLRPANELEPWSGPGRNPSFERPLLLPSLVAGLEPGEHRGLPAWAGHGGLYEGRAVVTLPPPPGRRPA